MITNKEMSIPKLIFTFPSEDHLNDFIGWLSDGGGEQLYMDFPCVHCYAELDSSNEQTREG